MKSHQFRFFRAGGVDQVRLTTGRDLVALEQLDQKLWVALSCPVAGLQFDERTLALIDGNGDGRVRALELLAAIGWAKGVLTDVEQLAAPDEALPLSAIDAATEEGALLARTARSLLTGLGRPDAEALTVLDVMSAVTAFAKLPANGDGVVPAQATSDEELSTLLVAILAGLSEPKLDASGEPGVVRGDVIAFFDAARARSAWLKLGEAEQARPLGDKSAAAVEAFSTVAPKVEDFYARVRVAAFDDRALAALNRDESAYAILSEELLDSEVSRLGSHPLARAEAGRSLPLTAGLNPAWATRLEAFRLDVVVPLLGPRASLSESDYLALKDRFREHVAWRDSEPPSAWAGIEPERLERWLESRAEARLLELIQADEDAAPQAGALELVEKLVRYKRDLLLLCNNFVAFREFYRPGGRAIFQIGTLYIDQRALGLVLRVNDAARHAKLGPLSGAYLLYCDATNAAGKSMPIVAAVTNGDVDSLSVGRNGVFYDREGHDWDATVTRIVESPISVRQAFWSPYKKLVRLIEGQVNKRAAAAEAEADASMTERAGTVEKATQGNVSAAPPAPKKLDIGVVAALGVAVGGITAALGVFLQAFLGLGFWMPLGVVGMMLAISGPSVAVAALKLRRRNIGPLLDANGWAVNVLPRINMPLGGALTSLASLPRGASRDLADPYAEKKRPFWRVALSLVVLALGAAWYLGKLDAYVPRDYRSTSVLGAAAPAHVQAAKPPEGVK